jgi:hypothetical protein
MSMHRIRVWGGLLLLVLVAGCSKKVAEEPASAAADGAAAMAGQGNAPGSFLAYSHEASIRLPAEAIATRVAAVRKACMERVHGDCTVLGEQQSAGQWPGGQLVMRAAPGAIEPLVATASEGAEISERSTQAEDLADAVRDNGLRRQRLQAQHVRLSEFLTRRDLKAEDLIALGNQLAQIEAELQSAEQESAQQQRRINTNLLTLNFRSSRVTAESSELRSAFRDSLDVLDSSMAVLVTVVVALLPFLVFGAAAVFVVRAWLRRRRRSAT